MENAQENTHPVFDRLHEATKDPPRFSAMTMETVYTARVKENPLITGFMQRGDPVIFQARGGVGKSLITQDISMHGGAGLVSLWDRFDIPRSFVTVFIQAENGLGPIHNRTAKKCKGNSDFIRGLSNIFYATEFEHPMVAGPVSDPKFREDIIEFCKVTEGDFEIKIDMIVFDPLISYHDTEENDNSRMRSTLDQISTIANSITATPAVIHHESKVGSLRGASAIFDWARSIIRLEDVTYKNEKRIKITHEKSNNANPFSPFILQMDDFLNFAAMEKYEDVQSKERERCLMVQEALELLGGTAETKKELIAQYKEISGVASEATIQRHVDQAVKNGFILREYYTDGQMKKARYFFGKDTTL